MKKTVTLIGALLLICALLLGCDLPAPEPVDTTQETTETNPVGSIQESTAPGEEPKRGCKSFVGACVPVVIIAAGAVCFKKRKRK